MSRVSFDNADGLLGFYGAPTIGVYDPRLVLSPDYS